MPGRISITPTMSRSNDRAKYRSESWNAMSLRSSFFTFARAALPSSCNLLRKLHDEGKAALANVKKEDRKLIAFHDSLRYFARSFDLDIVGVMEMRPGIAPDPSYFRKL